MSEASGRTVLITGGGTGIGRAAALQFLQAGDRVFVVGRREAPLEALAAEFEGRVGWISADLSKSGEAARVVTAAVAQFGGLDVLVNNAGAYTQGSLQDSSDEEIKRIFDINVFGTMALIREATPALIAAGGSVTNVTSTLTRGVMAGTSVYSSSKAALEHLTRILAAELGPQGVRVNAVAPGVTETDINAHQRSNSDFVNMIVSQTPLGRLGTPDDVARIIVQVSSADAGWLTGQVIQASGGLML